MSAFPVSEVGALFDGRAAANARDIVTPVSHTSFRARLAAASFSRREMATVMAETLRALGYDVAAWDMAQWTVTSRCRCTNDE